MLLSPPGIADKALDVDALFAIARVTFARAEVARRRKQENVGVGNENLDASKIAYDAIVWSDETRTFMEKDRERFSVPAELEYLVGDAWENPGDPMNQIGDSESLSMGFNVAMKIAARIIAAPLAHHDADDILAESQEVYLELLEEQRDKYFQHRWSDRLARAKAEAAARAKADGRRA